MGGHLIMAHPHWASLCTAVFPLDSVAGGGNDEESVH
jgi:hypothetical protein